VEADLMEVTAADRAEARGRFHARHVGGHQIGTRLAAHERRGQHRRPDARGRMDDASGVRVVEVEPVRQHAVHQRGIARAESLRQADHRHPSVTTEARDRRQGLVREIIGAGRIGDAGRVEHQMLGALAHIRGDRLERQVVRELRERARNQRARSLGLQRGLGGAGHGVHRGTS
jgi:hypothetical protein